MTMNEEEYDNIWTKLGLGKIRGHWLFKGIWRTARVGVVGAGLAIINELGFLLAGFGVPIEYIPLLSVFFEKIIRLGIKPLKF